MSDWEVTDYLEVLGFAPDRIDRIVTGAPSPGVLAAIHRAHVERVPYETLEFQLGRAVTLDVDESVRRILSGRGGYCFMLNSALAALLTRLGYRVLLHRGGVQGHGQEPVGANGNHLALTVHDLPDPRAPEGVWLVDAGLGDALHEPVPLVVGSHPQGPFRYRLRPSPTVPNGMRFDHDPSGSFEGMDFTPDATTVDGFSDMHRQLSTDPESGFVRTATVQRRHADGADVLRGCVLRRITADGVDETVAAEPGTWFSLLADVFGLRMDDLAPADLERLWRTVLRSHREWVRSREDHEFELRPATVDDCPVLVETSREAFGHDVHHGAPRVGGPPGYDSIDWIRHALDTRTVLVLILRGKVVGGAVVSSPEPDRGRVHRIWLVPQAQGKGLGAILLSRIEERFPLARVLTLDTPVWNLRNQHFYTREGYVERGRTPGGLIEYEKVLARPRPGRQHPTGRIRPALTRP